MSRFIRGNRFSPWPQSTNSPLRRRSRKLRLILKGFPSWLIRLTVFGRGGPTRESMAMYGLGRQDKLRVHRWSRSSSGRRRSSGRKSRAVFRWARLPTNGPMGMSIPVSRMRRSSLMKHSSLRTPAIRRLRPGVPWLTGKTARFTSTPARRARRKPCRRLHAG